MESSGWLKWGTPMRNHHMVNDGLKVETGPFTFQIPTGFYVEDESALWKNCGWKSYSSRKCRHDKLWCSVLDVGGHVIVTQVPIVRQGDAKWSDSDLRQLNCKAGWERGEWCNPWCHWFSLGFRWSTQCDHGNFNKNNQHSTLPMWPKSQA